MTVLFPRHNMHPHPSKRMRRNATAVMAGVFDEQPKRDVLTSLLNGVPPYWKAEMSEEEEKAQRKREKKEKEKEKKDKQKAAELLLGKKRIGEGDPPATADVALPSLAAPPQTMPTASTSVASFYHSRPTIHIPAVQRSLSVTPSPTSSARFDFSPSSTPGPSVSSSTSRTSSKRPRTPDDFDEYDTHSGPLSAPGQRPRKKRVAAKKGWKGWVEGSPPPSEKLINLDGVAILQERRTRSGKNFDAY